MEITRNWTGMKADRFVATDKTGRDHCVVVVKGTFRTDPAGTLMLCDEQRPLVHVDEHYGDPATSCIRHAGDFAPEKPLTDVVVVGKAVAPGDTAVRELAVRLEVEGRNKDALVLGERRWARMIGGLIASNPVPFKEMPLTFDRAFGGQDDSRGPQKVAVERRNLSGVGFNPHRAVGELVGHPLPNVERVRDRISSVRDRPEPIGFGHVSPAWEARAKHGGTYDERWLAQAAPFLPADFDPRYHQTAPEDQRFPLFRGGEIIRCFNMSQAPVVVYRVPSLALRVGYGFDERVEERAAVLDTVVLEPHLAIAMLVWRASIPIGKKPSALKRISVELVGDQSDEPRAHRDGKPVFAGLGAAIRWHRRAQRRRAGT